MYSSFAFGSVLKDIRISKGFSQRSLAENICSQAMLSRIENNDAVPSVILMKQLCDRLAVSLDYVLGSDYGPSSKPEKENEWLLLLRFYHQNLQYPQLLRVIDETTILTNLSTAEELQEYYFYYGCALIYTKSVDPAPIDVLQKGLALTYCKARPSATALEIMLLSEIGKAYADSGQSTIGIAYMKKSLAYFYNFETERLENQLAKIFYNMATLYIDFRNYKAALKVINQGISWCGRNKIFYFLDELFLLKGIVLQDNDLIDDAIRFVQVAETLKELSTGNYMPSEKKLTKKIKKAR